MHVHGRGGGGCGGCNGAGPALALATQCKNSLVPVQAPYEALYAGSAKLSLLRPAAPEISKSSR